MKVWRVAKKDCCGELYDIHEIEFCASEEDAQMKADTMFEFNLGKDFKSLDNLSVYDRCVSDYNGESIWHIDVEPINIECPEDIEKVLWNRIEEISI